MSQYGISDDDDDDDGDDDDDNDDNDDDDDGDNNVVHRCSYFWSNTTGMKAGVEFFTSLFLLIFLYIQN